MWGTADKKSAITADILGMAIPNPSDALTRHLAFTQHAVDTLKPHARGFVEYYDTKTPGLALRVQPTGKTDVRTVHLDPH